jgi:SAM-dependent methyltransferase
MTRAFLRQAADLVEHPDRAGGWEQPDELLLQGVGRLSAAVVDAFRAAEAELDGLSERLHADGATFLDVGTGTGWLAMAMARAYDDLQVVGIDVFEPALALARRNVAFEQLDGRVELWLQDGADLGVDEAYDVIWLPLPFLVEEVVPGVVRSCAGALRSGGWLLAGAFAGTGERLSELLMELRTVRAGGHVWEPDDLAAVFEDAGLESAGEVPRTWATPVRLYAARRP